MEANILPQSALDNPKPDQARRARAFANDMESIPFYMSIFWAAFLVEILAIEGGTGDRLAYF